MSNNTNNSNNNINFGMIMQLISSHDPNISQPNNVLNYSVGNKIINFNTNNILTLSPDFDTYCPQYIAINLYPNQNLHLFASEYIYNVCHLFNKMRLVLQVSDQTILQLPLSLLYELNPPELIDGKIYIKIPFDALFDKINVAALYHSTVTFSIIDFYEISNYANTFSLVTKVYMHDTNERNRIISTHSRNFIQQIGSLYISNVPPNDGRLYQIQTNILNGPTKGFLIQCCIQDLISIKFYINGLLRINYERFLILNACVKISENLIYMPFNEVQDFQNRNSNTFSGYINLSRLQNSTLCLQFSANQSKVVIHNVYFNYFRQSGGLGGLYVDNRPSFIENTTESHPIQPIISSLPSASLLDMSGNYIQSASSMYYNPIIIDMSFNYIYNNLITPVYSRTTSTIRTGSSETTGTVGLTGPPNPSYYFNNNVPVYSIPNGNIIYCVINSDRNTCNITHEDILIDQRYMTCSNCENNYSETAIKQWLSQHTGNARTCPTCREVWTNFNVYINQDELN